MKGIPRDELEQTRAIKEIARGHLLKRYFLNMSRIINEEVLTCISIKNSDRVVSTVIFELEGRYKEMS